MKCMLVRVRGYNYVNKEQVRKVGRIIVVQSSSPKDENDGKGNFYYGYPTEEIVFRNNDMPDADLLNLVGHECELVYSRNIGDKYERLVEIRPVK